MKIQCGNMEWRQHQSSFLVILMIVMGVQLIIVTRKLAVPLQQQQKRSSKLATIPNKERSVVPLLDYLTRERIVNASAMCPLPRVYIQNQQHGVVDVVVVPPLSSSPTTSSSSNQQQQKLRQHTNSNSIKPHRRIPRIMHQTSKSRCLTPKLAETIARWDQLLDSKDEEGDGGGIDDDAGWLYYFHDDDAVDELLRHPFPEFPHLPLLLDDTCLLHGTLKADLWRYLVLWTYGGMYADLDSYPNFGNFTNVTITPETDSFFVIEAYHLLSQYFMAASPRHPLMYYAIQYSILNLLQTKDTKQIDAASVTGPHALHAAFQQFQRDVGNVVRSVYEGPVDHGVFVGTNNRSVTAVGHSIAEDFIHRESISRDAKEEEYKEMGMVHFLKQMRQEPSNVSCVGALYQRHHASAAMLQQQMSSVNLA